MLKKGIVVPNSDVLILGFTFKENCPDCRNTKIVDIVKALEEYNLNITIYDPWANSIVAKYEYNIEITNELPQDKFDAVILGVAHNEFKTIDIPAFGKVKSIIYDVKWLLPSDVADGRL